MKYFRKLLFLVPFLFITNCQANWEFNLVVNDGGSGNFTISILIDQEAQQYALDTGLSPIGGLDIILDSLPDGFGSTIFNEGDFLGIKIRQSFDSFQMLNQQLDSLKENENTSLLLTPLKEINFEKDEDEYTVNGKFSELLNKNLLEPSDAEQLYSGSLSIKLPGTIQEPKLNEINDNTVIFLHDGLNEQTFLISSNNARNQWILGLIIVMLLVILFFGRQLFYRQ